jgi:C-terminal processing protease CtpA/Prc
MLLSPSPAASALSQPVPGKPVESPSSGQASRQALQTRRLEKRLAALTDQVAILTETVSRLDQAATQRAQRPSRQVDEARLIAAGFDSATATTLVKQLNQSALDKMYLRDQALREGWLGTEKYQDARAELQQEADALWAELDESDHDRLLYATGKPNRVTVESVIGESAAAWVGLQAGDHILRYAGGRVYGWSDLRQASSAGEAGALVPIQIERDGRILDLSIERGPLGIRLGVESVNPEMGFESH